MGWLAGILLVLAGFFARPLWGKLSPKIAEGVKKRNIVRILMWAALGVAILLTASKFLNDIEFFINVIWDRLTSDPAGVFVTVLAFVLFVWLRRTLSKMPAPPPIEKPGHGEKPSEATTH